MPESNDRAHVSAVLRATWDDRARLGEVVVVVERDGARSTIFERTCDAWCFPLHLQKGSQRALEYLGTPEHLGYAAELF